MKDDARSFKSMLNYLIEKNPNRVLGLIEDWLSNNIANYDKPTLYHLGQLVERARRASPTQLRGVDIITYVGATNYERGLEYLQSIDDFVVGEDIVSAIVHGTNDYETWASIEGGHITQSSCSCPVHSNICKHVAALLVYCAKSSIANTWKETILKEIAHLL